MSEHGGRRPGAGRPQAVLGGTTQVAFSLGQAQIDKIEAWKQKHGCSGAAEALRQMIDLADQVDRDKPAAQPSIF